MKKNLLPVLSYFGYFLYAPSFEEIHTFFPKKISKKNLQILLSTEVNAKKIVRLPNHIEIGAVQRFPRYYSSATKYSRYTLPQYSIKPVKQPQFHMKDSKLRTTLFFSFLKTSPLIQFVGITGASAMWGWRKNDDLDLCIISKQGLLWTTRFFVVTLAKLLGLHSKTGVCLNLFFDESDLLIPQTKQNMYIAHEVLQMKPYIDKSGTYQKFFLKNTWVYTYFPNAKKPYQNRQLQRSVTRITPHIFWCTLWEHILKGIQLPIILRNKSALSITDTQLWLFKTDFEKKLKQAGLVI